MTTGSVDSKDKEALRTLEQLVARAPEIAGKAISWGVPHTRGHEILRELLEALRDGRLIVTEGWQDISTAPRDGTDIILLANGQHYIGRFAKTHSFKEPQWQLNGYNNIQFSALMEPWPGFPIPTHWMPLPAPAKE